MNRFFRLSLATLLSFFIWYAGDAQGIVVEHTQTADAEAQINHALAALPMTPVTSGVLLDRTFPLFDGDIVGGSTLADSVWMSYATMDLAYRSIYAARIPGNTTLPSAEVAYANTFSAYTPSATVPLVLSALVYQKFAPDAIDNGHLTISGGQLHYAGGGSPASAYLTERVYGSGLYNYFLSPTTTFTLPTANLVGNVSIQTSSIAIDADDGLGFRSIALGGSLTATYTSSGVRVVKIRYSDAAGTQVVHYHPVEVTGSSSLADGDRHSGGTRGGPLTFTCPPGTICGDITADDGSATINYSIRLSCLNANGTRSTDITKLKKPLIILDGIDLSWTNNEFDMSVLINAQNVNRGLGFFDANILGGQSLGQTLDANDYDIVFLDYHDHHTRIENNAAAFQAVLRFINATKIANGSTFKNIVMGISMGGVIGRYGLREMEINGENHDVETYITFDSPMQGGNIPLMGQAALKHGLSVALPFWGPLSVIGSLPVPNMPQFPIGVIYSAMVGGAASGASSISAAYGSNLVLNSIAAKQLVKYSLSDPDASEHFAFYNKLQNVMGPLQNCKTVGISNGSGNGAGGTGEMGAGELAFRITDRALYNIWAKSFIELLSSTSIDVNINGYTAPGVSSAGGNLVYFGDVTFSYLWGLLSDRNSMAVYGPSDMKPIDTCPGGTIGATFIDRATLADLDVPESVILNGQNFCFIPTVSALDIQGIGSDLIHPNLLNNDFSTTTYDDINTQTGTVVVNRIGGGTAIVNNNSHVIMDFQNISLLLNTAKVEGESLTNPLTSRTYNFGEGVGVTGSPFRPTITPDYFKRNMHITGSGKVWINRNDRIAYTDVALNVANAIGTHFDVTMGKDLCSGAAREVLVNNGGELSIGQWSSGNTGSLTLNDQTKLTIGSGGIVTLDEKSFITIKQGGTVEILPGGKLIVKKMVW